MTFVFVLTFRHHSDSWVCGVFESMAGARGQQLHDRGMELCAICFGDWKHHHIKQEEVRI